MRVYVRIIQDLSLVVHASHECLRLFLRDDIKDLVINAFETALDHCILTTLGLKYTLVYLVVIRAYSHNIDYHVARNSLFCIVYHMFVIHNAVYFRFETYKLGVAMSVVLILENRSRKLLGEIKE